MVENDTLYEIKLSDVGATPRYWHDTLSGTFFTNGAHWGLFDAALSLAVSGVERGNLYVFSVEISGRVLVECDRCLRPLWLPLDFDGVVRVARASIEEPIIEEEYWQVPQGEMRVNFAPYIAESVYLSLPMQHHHGQYGTSEEDCDPSVLALLRAQAQPTAQSFLNEESLAALQQMKAALEDN